MERSPILVPVLLIGIFMSIATIVSVLFLTASPAAAPTENATSTSPAVSASSSQAVVPFPEGGVLGRDGVVRTVRDFIHDADVEPWDEANSVYLLDESTNTENQPTFQIFYYPTTGSVGVALLDTNLNLARGQAEAALEKRLGLAGTELCSLQISVGTPVWVSDEWSGFELGLSMCPGAVTLP